METINGISKQTYHKIHYWIKKFYGKAKECKHPECTGKSKTYEWALNNDFEYDYNIDNFIQMCTSCHRKYDATEEASKNKSKAQLGKKLSQATKDKLRLGKLGVKRGPYKKKK